MSSNLNEGSSRTKKTTATATSAVVGAEHAVVFGCLLSTPFSVVVYTCKPHIHIRVRHPCSKLHRGCLLRLFASLVFVFLGFGHILPLFLLACQVMWDLGLVSTRHVFPSCPVRRLFCHVCCNGLRLKARALLANCAWLVGIFLGVRGARKQSLYQLRSCHARVPTALLLP